MKKSTIAFTILIVVTVGILFGLMEANIALQRYPKAEVDNYPYASFNIVHSEIKLNQDDIK